MPKEQKKNNGISPHYFDGSRVILGESPRWEEPITDQQAILIGAKQIAYEKGVDYRDVLWVWRQLEKVPKHLYRETAEKLWAEIDSRNPPTPTRHTPDARRKFLARQHPSGKSPKMSFMRQCPRCDYYFSADNEKRKWCSDECKDAEFDSEYFTEKQREHRKNLHEAERPTVTGSRICDQCGARHNRNDFFCSARCAREYQNS